MSGNIEDLDEQQAWQIDQLWCQIDSDEKYNKQHELLQSFGFSKDANNESNRISVREGLLYGNLAEIYSKQGNQNDANTLYSYIAETYISSTDLIMQNAYYKYQNSSFDDCLTAFSDLDSINFEEDKDEEEFESFYRLLAHSPYRKLFFIEGFWYRALLLAKYSDETDQSYSTLQQLASMLDNLGRFGYQESDFMKDGVQIDIIESEILKYFYGTFWEIAKQTNNFVTVASQIKDHVFRKDMLYSVELRRYILETVANHEIQYYNRYANSESNNPDKLVRNIQKYMKVLVKQLADFPNALNAIKDLKGLINTVEYSEDPKEIMDDYQLLILKMTNKDLFNSIVNYGVVGYKIKTFTEGELDDFRFFGGDNSDIIPEFLKQKETYYTLDFEILHEYYQGCLDTDPANGEYLYNVIRTYYKQKDFKSSMLLIEKYLMLNDSDRMYNKVKVLIIAIKILANSLHKYDDALTYSGDLLNIIDDDFVKPKKGKGYGTFYRDAQNRIAANIYLTSGLLYASYASRSEFDKNRISRFK